MNYEFAASNEEVLSINGINHIRVKEPYYNDRKGVIYGICPHCGYNVQRVWNLNFCGTCGGAIHWHNVRIAGIGDVS
jgi:hypothetical protein